MLADPKGEIKRIADFLDIEISDEAVSGYIQLGFEFIDGARHQVLLAHGHEWAIWRLRSKLEDKTAALEPVVEYLEDHTAR